MIWLFSILFQINFQSGKSWAPSLLILVISIAVIVMVKRLPYLFVGWLWYVITLLPVIGIIQIGELMRWPTVILIYLLSALRIMLAWGIPFLIKSENIT